MSEPGNGTLGTGAATANPESRSGGGGSARRYYCPTTGASSTLPNSNPS
jgi:hypothetical protein